MGLIAFVMFVWAPGPVTLTTDEPTWLARSDRFRTALADGDLSNVDAVLPTIVRHQTSPGVTTIWAGTIGRGLVRLGQSVGVVEDRPPGPRTDQLVLRGGRAVVSLLCALGLGLLVWAAARLVGRRAAVLAGLLVACEPFFVGHAGVLHTDALVTIWGATAIVSLASALAGRLHTPSLVVSAVATGLALLTKVSAAPLVLGGAALVLVATALGGGVVPSRRAAEVALARWLGIVVATFVLLWPAVWVGPLHALREMLDSFGQVDSGDRTYFLGSTTTHPGPAYYPVALLVRTTPWLVVLAAAGLALTLRRVVRDHGSDGRPLLVAATLLAPLPYLVLISFSAQRYDRYALPAIPFMALAGGIALDRLVDAVRAPRRAVAALGVAVLAVPFVLVLARAPYNISYVDPIVGQRRAEHLVLLGWGEGMERLGQTIERREAGRCDDVDVLVFNRGLTIALPCGRLDGGGRTAQRTRYEYAVHYVSQRQRKQFDGFYRSIERQATLVDSVRIGGVTYAELWAFRERD